MTEAKGRNRNLLWGSVLVILLTGAWLLRGRIHFDFHTFIEQLKLANWGLFGAGVLLIYLAYGLRAVRWALFLRPTKRVSAASLIGTQVIGFTAVALFGRLADLVRPYLVARRTKIPLPSQIAVYAVERIFDLGSNAVIFAGILLLAPDRNAIPHPEAVRRLAIAALAAAVVLAGFAVIVRKAGHTVAELFGRGLGALSPKLGAGAREKILGFRDGLNAIDSIGTVFKAAGLSLVMWFMIVYAYLVTVRAFTASPPLHGMTLAQCLVLMVASQAASMVQLPVIGWFTQIGIVAKAIQSLFGAAPEPSLGAGAMLLIVTFLSVIPAGLIWSRFEHVSLKRVTEESESATEEAFTHQEKPEFVPEA